MEMKLYNWIGIIISLIVISLSFLFKGETYILILGIGVLIGVFPFIVAILEENRIKNEKEEMFLEFARSLVESVKTGTPISKSIINVRGKSYGVLSDHINKLANQIYLGIPLNSALKTFSKDVKNNNISRALTLIGHAERAGGEIGEILESVVEAVTLSDKLRKERKATISTLVIQGYIIFFVFIGIILIMQFRIIPMLGGIAGGEGASSFSLGGGGELDEQAISNSFVYLLLIQGAFTGLTIGKLAEGNIRAGIRHSFALTLISFLVSTGAGIILG
jgi:archaeal flagellar protein FlaJ